MQLIEGSFCYARGQVSASVDTIRDASRILFENAIQWLQTHRLAGLN